MSHTILFLDPDRTIHTQIGAAIRKNGYHIISAFSGHEALRWMETYDVDLMIMDLVLPDMGRFHLRHLVQHVSDAKIIVCSAIDDEDSRVRALNEGADDFVRKPVASLRELLMRMRTILLRGCPREIVLSRIRIELINRRVWSEGQEIELTPQRYRFLVALASHPNRVRTCDELLFKICGWEEEFDYRLLYTLVYAVRQRIEPDASRPQFIQGIHGIGYYFREPGDN